MAQTSPSWIGWTDLRREPDDPRPPAALVVGLAFAAQLAWVALYSSLGLPDVVGVVGIVGIAIVSSWWLTAPASVLMALVSLLVADGFVQNRLGNLTWDGDHDVVLLLILLVGCALSSEMRSGVTQDARGRRERLAVPARR